ncbi:MAG: hypothetical protein P8L46_01500 [Acidimicrobiales bacterium]|nr:hypothetical protein [Acidimicrobiales bacterium]
MREFLLGVVSHPGWYVLGAAVRIVLGMCDRGTKVIGQTLHVVNTEAIFVLVKERDDRMMIKERDNEFGLFRGKWRGQIDLRDAPTDAFVDTEQID